jgi:hypothetical protein
VNKKYHLILLFLTTAMAGPAVAQSGPDKPAVDGLNGKLSLHSGFGAPIGERSGLDAAGYMLGSISAPLGRRFGI